jgi:hypothetical protein
MNPRIVEVNEAGHMPFYGINDVNGDTIATTEHHDIAVKVLQSVITQDAFYQRLRARSA